MSFHSIALQHHPFGISPYTGDIIRPPSNIPPCQPSSFRSVTPTRPSGPERLSRGSRPGC